MSNYTACACMGPRGDDPHCPCRMYALGLEPTPAPVWTEQEQESFRQALKEIFGDQSK